MKKIFANIVRFIFFRILKLFRYKPALQHDFLKLENEILRKKIHEQGISIDDIESGGSFNHESTKTRKI